MFDYVLNILDNIPGIKYWNLVLSPTPQVHCLQFLIYEVVSGGNMRKPGGLFGNTGSEIPVNDLKQLETFFYKLGFFLHVIDYTGLANWSFLSSLCIILCPYVLCWYHILDSALHSCNGFNYNIMFTTWFGILGYQFMILVSTLI